MRINSKSVLAISIISMLLGTGLFFETTIPVNAQQDTKRVERLFRLYNPQTKDHLYTANSGEYFFLLQYSGYISEDVIGGIRVIPENGADKPIIRLYSHKLQNHFYTTSYDEARAAIKLGFKFEDIVGYVPEGMGTIEVYRLYNRGSGDHFYTASQSERDSAMSSGYVSEGDLGAKLISLSQ